MKFVPFVLLSLLFNDFFMNVSGKDSASATKETSVITEIKLGNIEAKDKIEVYISPSCLHCGRFVADDLEKFVRQNGDIFEKK